MRFISKGGWRAGGLGMREMRCLGSQRVEKGVCA